VPTDADTIGGRADYGGEFTASIWRDNLFATQFHPEKSQKVGLRMLENFTKL
jgi:glutamine amidotransferase